MTQLANCWHFHILVMEVKINELLTTKRFIHFLVLVDNNKVVNYLNFNV